MATIIFTLLVVTSAFCWCEKYVFVQDAKDWPAARKYCMDHYTEYLALTNKEEEQAFKKYVNEDGSKKGWIGLYWDKPDNKWKWAGGVFVGYHSNLNLPVNVTEQPEYMGKNVYWTKNGWNWKGGEDTCSFFCLNMLAVQEERTWEDALEHCRRNGADLTSLLSVTESLHAQSEIQQHNLTEQVWIGLRFLRNRWLWVNGDPLPYEAWPNGGDQDHQCPMLRRCVALTKQGVWESRDCQEKLSFICA